MQHNDASDRKTVRCTLGSAAALDAAGALEFRLGDGDWPLRVFAVAVDGGVRIYRNRCPHLGWPLNLQPNAFLTPDRRHIVCAGHGAVFDPASGVCSGGPCAGQCLESYPVRIHQDGTIEALIPAADLP